MTPRDFCYWLQGLFELGEPEVLTPYQIEFIKRHLAMVNITVSGKAPQAPPPPAKDEKWEVMC